jgi:hypothetical protein
MLFMRFKMCCPADSRPSASNATLVVWFPSEFELTLFSIYSPAQAMLWNITTLSNFIPAVLIMVIMWKQVS